ncbi:hypothetical protein JMJ56_14560 [Belnapia sp. T18]|uniref:Uncharacterized protein n=1 Tax=Belnapia arida TaxID=2804533 RepID=A0ABS1U3K2_9PROT|nr:hypothetical protein [Belnapia arida]MBL6079238.1 hypothetical protein [Belnapia arida]
MRVGLLPLLLLLGCAAPPEAAPPSLDSPDVAARSQAIGRLVRAGQACNLMLSVTTLDRAARIEAVALEQGGGTAARDDILRSMAPPDFGVRQPERDRWCTGQRPEVERMNALLSSPAGAALLQQAEVARAVRR